MKNGINGRMIISKKNVNKIFPLSAGERQGSRLDDVGSKGYYWSSTLTANFPHCARRMNTDSSIYRDFPSRDEDLSVRPVTE